MSKYKAIIIGGGHNGLVCSLYLAKKGYKVLVLEKNDKLGGLVNLSSSLNSISLKVLNDLNIIMPRLKNESYVISLNKESNHTIIQEKNNKINFHTSDVSIDNQKKFSLLIDKYKLFSSTLSTFMHNTPPRVKSGNSKDTWQLINMGWKIRKLGKKNMRELLRILGLNIADDLEDNLEDDALKGLLSHEAILGSNLGPRSPGSILSLLYKQAIQEGLFHSSKYDFHQFIPNLEKSCLDAGIEIRKNISVDKISTKNNIADGVVLKNGEKIESEIIVSNVDPKNTYFKILGTEYLDTDFIRRAKNVRTKGNVAKLTLRLNDQPQIYNIEKEKMNARFVYAPNINYIEKAFNANKYNKYEKDLCFEFHHCENVIVSNIYYVPYLINNTYDRNKLMQQCIDLFKPFVSNLDIKQSEIMTPNDIEEKYSVNGGNWHHGDFEIDQMMMMRPFYGSSQYSTPIKNLYLCSAGTHPGGGITGINGKNAAKKILDEQK